MIVTLELPYPVSTNRMYIYTTRGVFKSKLYLNFKQEVQSLLAYKYRVKPVDHDIGLHITLHACLTKKGVASKKQLDSDNSLKVLKDVFQGYIYINDKQANKSWIEYGAPKKDGGITVKVIYDVSKMRCIIDD